MPSRQSPGVSPSCLRLCVYRGLGDGDGVAGRGYPGYACWGHPPELLIVGVRPDSRKAERPAACPHRVSHFKTAQLMKVKCRFFLLFQAATCETMVLNKTRSVSPTKSPTSQTRAQLPVSTNENGMQQKMAFAGLFIGYLILAG